MVMKLAIVTLVFGGMMFISVIWSGKYKKDVLKNLAYLYLIPFNTILGSALDGNAILQIGFYIVAVIFVWKSYRGIQKHWRKFLESYCRM